MGGARPAAGPPARVQDVQGRGPGAGRAGRRRRPARCRPHAPAPRSASSTSRPTCSPASRPDDLRARLPAGHARPSRCPRVDLDHVAPIRASGGRRRRGAGRRAAPGRPHHLPGASPPSLVERLEVVVRFLAVLELFKQGLVDLDQAERFGDIAHRAGSAARPTTTESVGAADARRPHRRLRGLTADRRSTDRAGPRRRPGHRGHLMVADEPVEPQPAGPAARAARSSGSSRLCADLAAGYEAEGRGFVLVRVAGGYRFQSHPDLAPYVERFVLEGQSARLSAAALETLAIVAYKQPLSRAQVAAIRGVNVDGVMRTLPAAGLHRRGRPRPRARARPSCTAPRRCSSSGSASTRSTTCRRSATSCPAPTSSRRSSTACGSSPTTPSDPTPDDAARR